MRVAIVPILALLALASCRLVDQTSFGAAPHAPTVAELTRAAASDGTVPLLIVHPDDGVPYADDLRRAIAAVEAHGGNPGFRLVSVVPAAGDPTADASALATNEGAVRRLLDDMGSDGVTPDRVTLSAFADSHAVKRELRLYEG